MATPDWRALMEVARSEAAGALAHDDVPVGALVLSPDGQIVASRHNERELTGDPTAHAEVLALRDAADAAGTWRLDDHTLIVTLEPCVMCAGAAQQARIAHVVFGALDMKGGALGSLYNVAADQRFAHDFDVTMRVDEAACAELLTSFFAKRRP
ncbi:MAG: tRNA(adenine34) deaminase [Verrucomicrobiales bacterium]|jgi:tRNA(adenine34) deaminase